MGWWCRVPALKVLAMDLTDAPNLARGLVESAGATLQHLQLVMGSDSIQLFDGFWRAINGCTELAALHLVFLQGLASDQEVHLEGTQSFPTFYGCCVMVSSSCSS